jgi:hypothetical protein
MPNITAASHRAVYNISTIFFFFFLQVWLGSKLSTCTKKKGYHQLPGLAALANSVFFWDYKLNAVVCHEFE